MAKTQNLDGFMKGADPRARGRAVKFLGTARDDGQVVADWVKAQVAAGVVPAKKGKAFNLGDEKVTKAEYEYARFLGRGRTGKGGATKPRSKRARPVTGVESKPCLCGCGKATEKPEAAFLRGHDSKLKSILIKVEKEKEKPSAIPKIARPFITDLSILSKDRLERIAALI